MTRAQGYIDFIENINRAIFTWLHEALNTQPDGQILPENDPRAIPVIRATQGAVRPDKTYCEFDFLTSFQKLGLDDELLYDNISDNFKLKGQREFAMTVNFEGEGALALSALAQQSLDSPDVEAKLRLAGLAYRDANLINDRTVFQETSFMERAVLDLRLAIVLELKDAVQRIEKVELVSGLPGGSTTVVET